MTTPDLTFSPANAVEALRIAIRRRIVGQDLAVDELLAALLARGHVLLEGVPGVAKTLLVRVYAGALTQIKDQTVEITKTQPVPQSTQVVVQSEVRGKGEPIKLDYRLDKVEADWKIIDVNVGGIWLVTSYRSQFAQELNNGGIDALVNKLAERNKAAKS